MSKKLLTISTILALFIIGFGLAHRHQPWLTNLLQSANPSSNNEARHTDELQVKEIATNLQTPWAIAELPDGDLLITERVGRLQRIGENGQSHTINGVEETSEGGLLGIAVHPNFSQNNFIYLYFTTSMMDSQFEGSLVNVVQRYILKNDHLQSSEIILGRIPASQNHDGGALAFGPDNKLYITTGDAGQAELAQDTSSLAGKILRINDDGSIPQDNPFDNAVWSYGHRNPQGIAWDEQRRLWSTEHGPSGIKSGRDELNLIEKGQNYGWPIITGDQTRPDMRAPVAQSGDNDTWAPAGLAYANNSLFFTGLRGQTLYHADIRSKTNVSITGHLSQKYGRLRAIFATNSHLIIGTSNHDGRGSPKATDDRLLQIPIANFTH